MNVYKYLVIFAIIALMLSIIKNKNYKKLLLSFMIFLFLLNILQWKVGADFNQYRVNFNKILSINFSQFLESQFILEPGYFLLNKIPSLLYPTSFLFFFSVGLISFSILTYYILNFSEYKWISVVFYLVTGFWNFQLNGIRQSLVTILVMVIIFNFLYNDRSRKINLILGAISISIHSSAFVIIMILLLIDKIARRNYELRKYALVLISITAIIGYFSIIQLTISLITNNKLLYGTYFFRKVSRIRILFNMWPLIFVNFNKNKLFNFNDFEQRFMNVFVLFNILFVLLSVNSPYLFRFTLYFIPIYIIQLSKFKLMNKYQIICLFVLIFFFTIFWYIDFKSEIYMSFLRYLPH